MIDDVISFIFICSVLLEELGAICQIWIISIWNLIL